MRMISRDFYLNELLQRKDRDIVKIITGIRRCGKSVLLFDLFYDKLLSLGVDRENIIRIRLDSIENEKLHNPLELYKYVKSLMKNGKRHYVLLDKIQLVDNFERAVNGIKSDLNADVYITGSNSRFLSSDINSEFRGRGMETHVLPFSFAEYYSYRGGEKRKAFMEYVLTGGLPYAATLDDENEKKEYLRTISDTVEINDITDRYGIKDKSVFHAVLQLLMSCVGSYVSSRKIADTLVNKGIKIDHKTVCQYTEYLCDSFLLYKTDRYDVKGKKYLNMYHKYYASDMGIRNSVLGFRQTEMTHILENIVFLELKKRKYLVDVGFNREKEIDFIARTNDDLYYIQVSYSVADAEVRKRELSAFRKLDDGYKKILITMDDDPFVRFDNGYKKLNAIDFLLDDESLEKI